MRFQCSAVVRPVALAELRIPCWSRCGNPSGKLRSEFSESMEFNAQADGTDVLLEMQMPFPQLLVHE